MDAVEFIKERDRMFRVAGQAPSLSYRHEKSAEEIAREVERWSAAHPRKTRQSVFLEQYPEASIGEHGVLLVCPCPISASHRNALGGCATIGRGCDDCRKEYWMQEVE